VIDCLIEVTVKNGDYKRFQPFFEEFPKTIFCYRIAGNACYMIMITVSKLEEIEEFINEVSSFAATVTHIVFSEVKTKSSLEEYPPLFN
jgi:Lrp/AsnC family transcriptional regulator, leucine-responsive regulatory protein